MLDPAIWIFSSGEHRALECANGRQGVEKCLNGDACHISDKVHLLLTPRGKDKTERMDVRGTIFSMSVDELGSCLTFLFLRWPATPTTRSMNFL